MNDTGTAIQTVNATLVFSYGGEKAPWLVDAFCERSTPPGMTVHNYWNRPIPLDRFRREFRVDIQFDGDELVDTDGDWVALIFKIEDGTPTMTGSYGKASDPRTKRRAESCRPSDVGCEFRTVLVQVNMDEIKGAFAPQPLSFARQQTVA